MAAPNLLPIAAGGAVLVRMTAGLFTPSLVLVVPAGTRPPRGVHAVAVAAEPAAAGSARRGAMRWALAAAPAPGDVQDDDAFYAALEAKGAKAIQMLNWIEPPAARFEHIKDAMEKSSHRMAKAKEDKFSCVQALLFGIYGVIDLARESAPAEQAAGVDEQWFKIMMVASRVDDPEAMVESVTRALHIAANLLANADD